MTPMPRTRARLPTVIELEEERDRLLGAISKIRTAACDGQNGSANYALDRLSLIQAIATTILQTSE